MSQTPQGGDYFSQDSVPGEAYPPAETYGTADPYATPTTDYVAMGESYDPQPTYDTTYTQGPADQAKDEAANVKDTAVQAGQQVAGTAKDEATNVAVETGAQAKDIARQAVGELQTQAGAQKEKIAGLVHSYARELGSMASGSNESGPLTDLAQRASAKAGEIGHWLEDREPRDLVQELSSLARRRPGAFLVGAAVAGVVVGRLTRNLAADAKDNAAPSAGTPAYTGSTYPAATYTDASYTEPGSSYSDARYADEPTYTQSAPASLVSEVEGQGGRYGDLASEDQVVGYDTPVQTPGRDVIR